MGARIATGAASPPPERCVKCCRRAHPVKGTADAAAGRPALTSCTLTGLRASS